MQRLSDDFVASLAYAPSSEGSTRLGSATYSKSAVMFDNSEKLEPSRKSPDVEGPGMMVELLERMYVVLEFIHEEVSFSRPGLGSGARGCVCGLGGHWEGRVPSRARRASSTCVIFIGVRGWMGGGQIVCRVSTHQIS